MKSRTRYGLIALGFALFIIATPFIVMYVSGTRYDFENHAFVKTGIISIRTSPRSAKIYLNDKYKGKTQKNIKFVEPGDYDIKLSKDGFFDWQKRLNVKSQYVTYINKDLDYLVMFRSNGERNEIAKDVLTISSNQNRAIYLQKDGIFVGDIHNIKDAQKIPLDHELLSAKIMSYEGNNLHLILGIDKDNKTYTAVFDETSRKIYSLDSVVTPNQNSNFKFYNGTLFELTDKNLYSINWQTAKKNILLQNVDAYNFSGYYLYLISAGQISRTTLPNISLENLISNVPAFANTEIYVSNQRQVFILGDGNFYSVGNELNQLGSGINSVKIDNVYRKLMFSGNNEINLYDLSNGMVGFVTRSSETIKDPQIFYREGWVFFNRSGKIQALELDTRDRQNNYSFADTSADAPFAVSPNARELLVLNKGVLTLQQLR